MEVLLTYFGAECLYEGLDHGSGCDAQETLGDYTC